MKNYKSKREFFITLSKLFCHFYALCLIKRVEVLFIDEKFETSICLESSFVFILENFWNPLRVETAGALVNEVWWMRSAEEGKKIFSCQMALEENIYSLSFLLLHVVFKDKVGDKTHYSWLLTWFFFFFKHSSQFELTLFLPFKHHYLRLTKPFIRNSIWTNSGLNQWLITVPTRNITRFSSRTWLWYHSPKTYNSSCTQ